MPEALVIMPFGRRSYLNGETPSVADFDVVYDAIIRPAAAAAGVPILRIDELYRPGSISSQYLEKIVSADLVIADLSMPNGNVFYELGIRQAYSHMPVLLIAAQGTHLPFDLQDQRVLFYAAHDEESQRVAATDLSRSIRVAMAEPYQNPVHQHLSSVGLAADPSNLGDFERDLRGKIDRARTAEQLRAVWYWTRGQQRRPPLVLLSLAEKVASVREWEMAAEIAEVVCATRPFDYEVHRLLGWYLRNAGEHHYGRAEAEFRSALNLNPGDHEALGMLGGLMKRQRRYGEAAEVYERGVREAPDNLYLRVAHAGVALLADPSSGEAFKLYEALLSSTSDPERSADPWNLVVAAEARFVLGDDAMALQLFEKAAEFADSPTTLASPADQLDLFAMRGFRAQAAQALAARLRDRAGAVGRKVVGEVSPVPDGAHVPVLPVIIHLSDPHFGYNTGVDGQRVQMHRFVAGEYSETLDQHMLRELSPAGGRLNLDPARLVVVISGDIVYQAGQDEYHAALAFCQALVRGLAIGPEQVVFCPGNHDVNWADAKADKARRFDNYINFLHAFYGEDLFRRLYPRISWDLRVGSPRPAPADIFGVHVFPDLGLEIYAFNSCVYETDQQHYGFIGLAQQRQVQALLDGGMTPSNVRVAVLHHHIHPYPELVELDRLGGHWLDASTVRDAGLFERFLERHGFDVVLHGHKHKPQIRETRVRDAHTDNTTKSLIVCGAGSCGVQAKGLEHSESNQYQILELLSGTRAPQTDFLRVEWRELAFSAAAEWSSRRTWVLQG